METRTQRIPKLTPCRCGRTPRLVEEERGIYAVECKCGVQFWLSPAKLTELTRRNVAEAWNKPS